jgi:HEAT repeat protein
MRLSNFKYFLLLIAVLFYLQPAGAQLPQNRTTATIVADALAVLPAQRAKEYRQTMTALVGTGEEGLMTLLNMFDSSGKNSNEKLEFAVSGWTNFVSNNAALRATTASTYGKALGLPLDKHVKQLVIRQLELIGDESNILQLEVFLTDEYLAGSAAQALANMDSPKAVDALLKALSVAKSEKHKIILVNALGQTDNVAAEPALLGLMKNASPELSAVLNTAISKTGSVASISALKQVVLQSAYSNKNNATASFIDLLNRLASTQQAVVKAEAEELLKAATKLNLQNLRVSAIELLMPIEAVNKISLLKYALKDKNDRFIADFMNLYTNYTDPKGTGMIVKKLKSAKSENTKATMIYWLGNAKASSAVSQITKYLNSENPALQKSAIISLSNIGGEEVLNALVGLLKSSDKATLSHVQAALESQKESLNKVLSASYAGFSEEGKMVALSLIGLRKMDDQYTFVYNEMQNGSEKVQKKAAQTLKNVASAANLPQLFDQLEKGDSKYITDLQAAANEVLSAMPVQEQLATITNRMKKSEKPYAFFSSLANTGSNQALEMILKGYGEPGKSSQAAFAALLSIKTFDAIYPLLDIARTSTKTQDVSKAVDALISLISKSDKTGIVKANYLQELLLLAKTNKQKVTILNQLGTTNSFQALLFIEQFLSVSELAEPAAQAGIKIALNSTEFAGSVTNRILAKISAALTNPDAAYQRQAIDKYLSENKNIEGFVSIFNGKDLTGWKGLVGNPILRSKMKPQELSVAQKKADEEAAQTWLVENGELVFSGKGNNLCTEKQYGDFEMLIDWKLLPGPEPDAGIYLRGTPQVQIWDTARVKVGAQVGSGGLYNNQSNPSKPLKVADQKVGEWNTFHIKMVGDRVTVYLNGELVTNNVMLENYWDRNLPIFLTEQIELQAHGSKVVYRNIYIKEIPRPEPFKLSKQEEKEGFEILFDGTNMHKWTGNTADYITENGEMVIYPSKSHGGNLYTKEQYSDFVFRFQFQLTPGANNGLGIRTPMEGDAAYVGMELQILDNEAPIYANLQPYQYHGSVYGIIASKRGFLKPTGEWNYQEVIAKGDYIKITLNGTVILEGNIREATNENGPADHKEHPGLFNKTGHIGFLGHGSVVRFKDIRIRKL